MHLRPQMFKTRVHKEEPILAQKSTKNDSRIRKNEKSILRQKMGLMDHMGPVLKVLSPFRLSVLISAI